MDNDFFLKKIAVRSIPPPHNKANEFHHALMCGKSLFPPSLFCLVHFAQDGHSSSKTARGTEEKKRLSNTLQGRESRPMEKLICTMYSTMSEAVLHGGKLSSYCTKASVQNTRSKVQSREGNKCKYISILVPIFYCLAEIA